MPPGSCGQRPAVARGSCDLSPGYYAARIDPERRKQSHIRQLEALGYTVTFQPAT
jgi:hypothetical protein